MAQAIESIAGSLQNGLLGGSQNPASGTFKLENGALGSGRDPQADARALRPGVPLEAVYSRLEALRREFDTMDRAMVDNVVVSLVVPLCLAPDGAAKATVMLELLGKERAEGIFTRLPLAVQRVLVAFVKRPDYRVPKHELMLEAGEELKSRILAENFQNSLGTIDRRVGEMILRMAKDTATQVLIEAPIAVIPRYLSYFEPEAIGKMLGETFAVAPARFAEISTTLTQLPQAREGTELDEDLLSTLTELYEKQLEDVQKPYFGIYKQIAEVLDDSAMEVLLARVAEPRVQTFLASSVMTFASFTRLPASGIKLVVEMMPVKSLAALSGVVGDEVKKAIRDALPQAKARLLDEEIERLQGKGAAVAEAAVRAAKADVLRRLRELKDQGALQLGGAEAPNRTQPISPNVRAA